jgi:hypothetical protein
MSSLIFPICLIAARCAKRLAIEHVRLAARAGIRYKSPAQWPLLRWLLSREMPMLRRTLLSAIASLFWFGISSAPAAQQTSPALGRAASTTLKKTLEAGLKARRPQEFAFLAMVAAKVEDGTLPRSLVESTFFWARRQGRYPFVYFQAGLRERAKRIGVVI